ncbi:MAG TPA: peptide ABC transporter substrate-binding protein [Oligoflexia bacterium]|nr:peptide ABC transporter substrate-binding protein [Oligoflexia bacterium]
MARRIGLWFMFSLLLTTLSAHARNDNVLRVRTFGEPATLDWNRAFTPVEATLVRNIQEGLVAVGTNLKVVPGVAERWTLSADGKTYKFFIRKNVKWSDGKPLLAQHFVDSWERLLDPETKATTAYLLFDIEGAEDYHHGKGPITGVAMRALNSHTLEVRLRNPVSYWLWIPTFWSTFPIRKDLIAEHGTAWDKPGKLISIGPYVLSSHEPNKRITLDRNPHYWGKVGNIDQIHAYLISDDKLAVEKFESGALDFVTRIGSADVRRLSTTKELRKWTELRTVHLDLNPNTLPTDSLALRKAVFHAIDRKRLSRIVSGAYEPATSFVPPGLLSFQNNIGLEFDLKKAKSYLKKVNPEVLSSLELVAPGFDDFILVGDFLQTELKKNLGIDLKISTFEPKRFYSSAVNFGGYHMILTHWTADYPDPDNFFSIFLSNAGNNRVNWKNTQYDELVLKGRTTSDLKARKKLYADAHKLLLDQHAIAHPLYYGKNHALVRKNIRGFAPTATNSYLFKDFSIK